MPRLRPAGRATGTLTNAQRETLEFGDRILDCHKGELFQSEAEARAAWRAHGLRLTEEFKRPGQRPAAYYRYELHIEPPRHWWEEAEILESRGLLSPHEEAALERTRRELAPDQGALYDAVFAHQGWGEYTLRRFQAEFAFAAGWHGRRGRTALEEKYTRLAQAARAELEKS